MQILEEEEYTTKNVLKSNFNIKHIHSALYFVIYFFLYLSYSLFLILLNSLFIISFFYNITKY